MLEEDDMDLAKARAIIGEMLLCYEEQGVITPRMIADADAWLRETSKDPYGEHNCSMPG